MAPKRVGYGITLEQRDRTRWRKYAESRGMKLSELMRLSTAFVVDADLLPAPPPPPEPTDEIGGVEPILLAGRPLHTVEDQILATGFRPEDHLYE